MRKYAIVVILLYRIFAFQVEAGIMSENEKKIFDRLDEQVRDFFFTVIMFFLGNKVFIGEFLSTQAVSHPKYWMPLVWAGSIVTRARKEGRVKDDFAQKSLLDKLVNAKQSYSHIFSRKIQFEFDFVNRTLTGAAAGHSSTTTGSQSRLFTRRQEITETMKNHQYPK